MIAGSSVVFLTCLMWQSSTKAEIVALKLCVSFLYVRTCCLTFILNYHPAAEILEIKWERNRKEIMWWEMTEQTLLSSYQSQIQPRNAVKTLKLPFMYRKSQRNTVAKETNVVKILSKLTAMINVFAFSTILLTVLMWKNEKKTNSMIRTDSSEHSLVCTNADFFS